VRDHPGGEWLDQVFVIAAKSGNLRVARWMPAFAGLEPAFGTVQDRLVKELRLAGIATIAAAN